MLCKADQHIQNETEGTMMSASLKPYIYKKGMNPALDAQFSAAVDYGWVKPGQTAVFWKTGLLRRAQLHHGIPGDHPEGWQ